MASGAPEIFEIPNETPWHYWTRRVAAALGRRIKRALPASDFEAEKARSSLVFKVSGAEPSFEEIEAVLHHPRVLAALEAEPAAPLSTDLPPPVLPRGFEALGWRKRGHEARVYDIVPLGLELDVLELRLAELDAVVDRFVVVECERSFSGVRKPLLLKRNWKRFERFHAKIDHVVLDPTAVEDAFPERVRRAMGIAGETPSRSSMWRRIRELPFTEDAVLISADVDEIPSRNFVHLIRNFEPPSAVRLRAPALRYRFGLFDDEATNFIFFLRGSDLAFLDLHPDGFRAIPGQLLACRGSVHLTSFLPPLGLVAKFAMHAEWSPPLAPFVRNEFGEVETMMRRGHWFTRPVAAYDHVRDPQGLIPAAAKLNAARYGHFWNPSY